MVIKSKMMRLAVYIESVKGMRSKQCSGKLKNKSRLEEGGRWDNINRVVRGTNGFLWLRIGTNDVFSYSTMYLTFINITNCWLKI